jgi:hypothetical protein
VARGLPACEPILRERRYGSFEFVRGQEREITSKASPRNHLYWRHPRRIQEAAVEIDGALKLPGYVETRKASEPWPRPVRLRPGRPAGQELPGATRSTRSARPPVMPIVDVYQRHRVSRGVA